MTGRLRVRPITVKVLAAALAASLAPASTVRAAADQQYPSPPYRDEVPADVGTDWSDQIPAHISVVDGAAELQRDGQREAAEENVPLLSGDRLRTSRGRVEVLFADGSALALDEYTDLDLLSDSLVRVQAGRIRLAIARGGGELDYRVDAAGTTTWLRSAGEYRIIVDNRSAEPDVFVTVLRGAAELESAGGRTLIRTGLEARATARNEPSLPYVTNVANVDSFDRWVDDQQRFRSGARSAQYLPAELRHYGGAFDQYGAWNYEQGYGYVWYPTVAADWRPYHHGGWSFYGSFGWTWIGGGRWTWPTHHYGRWGFRSSRWFWIPGRRWGPAWVSWASAPGYYGWCPLGFDNRPVISFTSINVYGGDRWRGWTVVPANRFGPRVAVSRWAVSPHTLNLSGGSGFRLHASAPVRPSVAVRQVEPLRAPTYASTRYAVPRSARSSTAGSVAGGSVASGSTSSGEARSGVARSRSASSPGRPSNPVIRPAGSEDSSADPPSTVRSAGPRPRSNPSPAPTQDSRPSGGRVSPRSSAPASDPGPGSRPSSEGRAVSRQRSMSSSPAPLPSERVFGRRPGVSSYESAPPRPSGPAQGPRRAPTREIGRFPTAPRTSAPRASEPRPSAPSYERAPRIERSMPSRPMEVERSAPVRSPRSGPERGPQIDRSAPSRAPAPRAERSAPSSGGSRGQARSRNGR